MLDWVGAENANRAQRHAGRRDATAGKRLTMDDVEDLLATPAGGASSWDDV